MTTEYILVILFQTYSMFNEQVTLLWHLFLLFFKGVNLYVKEDLHAKLCLSAIAYAKYILYYYYSKHVVHLI